MDKRQHKIDDEVNKIETTENVEKPHEIEVM
jgi:hypothetical protein